MSTDSPSQSILNPLTSFRGVFQRCTAVIFDFDGTLALTGSAWDRVNKGIFECRGVATPETYEHDIQGMTLQQIAVSVLKGKYGEYFPESVEQILAKLNSLVDESFYGVPLVDGAEAFIRLAAAAGKKIAIGTASPTLIVHRAFEGRGNLLSLIDHIVSCEDVGVSKPDPEVYHECLRRLGTPREDAIIFEDSFVGLQAAKRADVGAIICITMGTDLSENKARYCDFNITNFADPDFEAVLVGFLAQ